MHRPGSAMDQDEPIAEMNLIPLIDIALTLLIILMVTTAFVRNSGVNLNLPKTVTREGNPETDKDLTISVAANGALFVNGNKSDDEGVRSALKAAAQRSRDARVLIKGDRSAPYARVMDVMDLARTAGLSKITLPTDQKVQKSSDGGQ
jgi:biopolymer transport protein ExbD